MITQASDISLGNTTHALFIILEDKLPPIQLALATSYACILGFAAETRITFLKNS
jgi:hypothetical protein